MSHNLNTTQSDHVSLYLNTMIENNLSFTVSHHAVLFALLSRAVLSRFGEVKGEKIIRQAVRRYGEQRGQRMAFRAQRDGEPLSMLNYMAYSEWRVGPGETEQRMLEKVPEALSFVDRCPWHRAWVESDLLRFGRLYCLEIDQALVRGFNPELRLDVLSTLSNDDRSCEFVFHDANLTPANLNILGEKKSTNQQKGAVMSWEYHTAHLYHAVRSVVVDELNGEGEEALQDALAYFTQRYGEEAVRLILSYQALDFDCLPE